VTYAVRNLALDENGEGPHHLVPNEAKSFFVDFPNTAYRFERGHRIRLALSSSYWPLIWPSPKRTRITLHLANTRLTLPVRSAGARDAPVSFAEPSDAAPPETYDVISAPPLERWTHIDAETNRRSIQRHEPLKCVRFTEIDLEVGLETSADYKITKDDPNSASTRFEHRIHFFRGSWTVEVISIAELTSTKFTYNPSGSVEVWENGEVIFQRQWAPVIPRTCS